MLLRLIHRAFRKSRTRTGLVVALSGVIILIIRACQQQPTDNGVPIKGNTDKPKVTAGRHTSSAVTFPSMKEVIPAEKLFNSSYLLHKITKELETDGWTAPKEGVMARLAEMYKITRQNTATSLSTGKLAERVLLKAERWKGERAARSMGAAPPGKVVLTLTRVLLKASRAIVNNHV